MHKEIIQILEKQYSAHPPASKLKRLEANIKEIPKDKVGYVLSVIAAHVNNAQLAEILDYFKK